LEVFPNSKDIEEARVVRNIRERLLRGDGLRDDVVAGDKEAAQSGCEDAGECPQGRGLTSAIGADESHDLAGLDGEGDTVDRHEVAIHLVIVLDLDGHEAVLSMKVYFKS
jgi:hypothetical protein